MSPTTPVPSLQVWASTHFLTGWTERGRCLMCRRRDAPVKWLGPVISGGRHAPFLACETCTGHLAQWVRTYPDPVPPPPVGRTARTVGRATFRAGRLAVTCTVTTAAIAAAAALWWTSR
ncbi:hypothetical protein SUDANB171_02024 [Streptomyces sp. enrichment culture]|jgi:hypothetical protein|uniref:hypothetical protein n=1 Tax=Streptomyces xiamenensis TaxID=408015 RepID=UPI0036E270F7